MVTSARSLMLKVTKDLLMVDLNAKYTPTVRLHAGHTLSSMQQTKKLLDLIHIASFARNSRQRKVASEGLQQELEALAKIRASVTADDMFLSGAMQLLLAERMACYRKAGFSNPISSHTFGKAPAHFFDE